MSRNSKSTALWAFIKRERFGSKLDAALSIAAIAGYLSLTISLTNLARWFSGHVVRWSGGSMTAEVLLGAYVFVTYFGTVALFVMWLDMARSVRDRVRDVAEEIGLMAEGQHKLAEVVRRHAVYSDSRVQINQDTALRDAFSSKILPYMAMKLGRQDIAVAVKYAGRIVADAGASHAGTRQLTAVFRYPSVEGKSSQRPEVMESWESFVYGAFRGTDPRKQWVVIRDVQNLPTGESIETDVSDRNHRYKLHAAKCGFRSVLAFPLREPEALGAGTAAAPKKMKVSNILGFVSFDCPDPNAFDGLFAPMSRKALRELDNDGTKLQATKEFEFFFGIADTLATLTVLGDKADEGIANDVTNG